MKKILLVTLLTIFALTLLAGQPYPLNKNGFATNLTVVAMTNKSDLFQNGPSHFSQPIHGILSANIEDAVTIHFGSGLNVVTNSTGPPLDITVTSTGGGGGNAFPLTMDADFGGFSGIHINTLVSTNGITTRQFHSSFASTFQNSDQDPVTAIPLVVDEFSGAQAMAEFVSVPYNSKVFITSNAVVKADGGFAVSSGSGLSTNISYLAPGPLTNTFIFSGGILVGVSNGISACTAPSISTQPLNVDCLTNTDATFSVIASGTATLAYHWRSNGVNLVNGIDYGGVTTASMTASNVMLTNNYSVVITNSCGSITSSVATLNPTNVPSGPTLWYSQPNATVQVSNPYQFQGIQNTSGTDLNIVQVWLNCTGGGTPQPLHIGIFNFALNSQYGQDSATANATAGGGWVEFDFSPAIVVPAGTDFQVGYFEESGTVYYNADNSQDFAPYNWDGNDFRSLMMQIWIQ